MRRGQRWEYLNCDLTQVGMFVVAGAKMNQNQIHPPLRRRSPCFVTNSEIPRPGGSVEVWTTPRTVPIAADR